MLKFLKGLLVVLGGLVIILGIYLAIRNVWDLRALTSVANANNSASPFSNPRNNVLLMGSCGLVGGLLLGLGIGLPRRTFNQQYKTRQEEANARVAETTTPEPDTK